MKKLGISMNLKNIKVWNELPAVIRTSDSLNVFMDNCGTTSFHGPDLITYVFFISAICCISM